jgi:Cu-processing system permease protein
VMQDFGLATMSLTGLLLSVFVGVGMLSREVTSRTVYLVITRPVSRAAFIIGKFLGLLAVLLLDYVVLSTVFWLAILWDGGSVQPALLSAVLLIWVEMAVMIAASILFSAFTTPVLAAIFTFAFYVGGHLNDLVSVELLEGKQRLLSGFLKVVYFVLPNLEHFNVRTAMVYGLALPHGYTWLAAAYGLAYIALLLVFACLIFQRRDL